MKALVTGGGGQLARELVRLAPSDWSVSAVGNLTLVSASPAAALLLIAVDVLIIYAVTVHGGDLRSPFYPKNLKSGFLSMGGRDDPPVTPRVA